MIRIAAHCHAGSRGMIHRLGDDGTGRNQDMPPCAQGSLALPEGLH